MSLCGATPAQRHGATDGARLMSLCRATPAQRHGATDRVQLMSLCRATPAQRHGQRIVHSSCRSAERPRHGGTGLPMVRRGGGAVDFISFSLALIDTVMALFTI
jgi:hypothetical protein